jgi:hypothetical protein
VEVHLYTLHHKTGRDLRPVTDRFSLLALLLPPVWALAHGLWLTLLAEAVLLGLAFLWSPFAMSPMFYGIALILALEGGAVTRAELRLRRWRELGLVEARTPEGAEELYLRGEALT